MSERATCKLTHSPHSLWTPLKFRKVYVIEFMCRSHSNIHCVLCPFARLLGVLGCLKCGWWHQFRFQCTVCVEHGWMADTQCAKPKPETTHIVIITTFIFLTFSQAAMWIHRSIAIVVTHATNDMHAAQTNKSTHHTHTYSTRLSLAHIEHNSHVNYFICNIYVSFNANCERKAPLTHSLDVAVATVAGDMAYMLTTKKAKRSGSF